MSENGDPAQGTSGAPKPGEEPVWTYRGYQLRPGEFTSAMVHLYRAEISRASAWRQRLDSTTNWAVITTGATISFVFSGSSAHHSVVFLNALLVTLFLFIESRRYRYYELWSARVRLMETDFFATMLVPPFHPSPDWAESLAENLLHPHFTISVGEAVGRRLRRNYVWIYLVLGAAWVFKIWLLSPDQAHSLAEVLARASLGGIPGGLVALLVALSLAGVIAFALATIRLTQTAGEILPRFGETTLATDSERKGALADLPAWFRPSSRRRQFLTMIVTDHAKDVADHILEEMKRGVTALDGRGMYTNQQHTVLLCAVTVTEVPTVRDLVERVDPAAFVIVTPVHEVYGVGFAPLDQEKP